MNQPESGALGSFSSSVARLGGAAVLMTLAGGFAGRADAATWDAPVAISEINTTTAHEGYVAPDDAGSLLYISTTDGVTNDPKVLLSGASTPSDISATDLSSYSGAFHFQPNGANSFLASDPSTGAVIEVTDSSGGNYSSGSASVIYAGSEGYSNVAHDRVSGEMAYASSNGTDWDIYNLGDDSELVTGSGNQFEPSLDSTHNRLFYTYNNSGTYEIWVKDLSGLSSDEYVVDGMGPYYDQTGNRLYYAALNGSTYDAYYMDETTAAADPDADGDGYAVTAGPDCDDADAGVNPGADEVCADEVDNNCDGLTDDPSAIDATTWYVDNDNDGVGGSASTEACEATGVYVERTTGDYDDNDASVQTEPTEEPGVCEEGESEDGPVTEGDTVCGPDGEGVVYQGAVDYYSSTNVTSMQDALDWVEYVDAMTFDSTAYNGFIVTTSTGSRGGYALAITDVDMTELMAAPPSDGTWNLSTFRVDEGEATVYNVATGESEVVGVGTYDLDGEPVESDTDGDGVPDSADAFPNDSDEVGDADSDGTGDNEDQDDDNDGYSDADEAAAGTNPNDSDSYPTEVGDDTGVIDSGNTPDTDGEGDGEDTDAQQWEVPGDDPKGCNSAAADLSLFSSPAPWLVLAAGLTARGRRRKTAKAA